MSESLFRQFPNPESYESALICFLDLTSTRPGNNEIFQGSVENCYTELEAISGDQVA